MISGALIRDDIGYILQVVPFTVGTAFLILISGILLGFVIAVIRLRRIPILRQLARVFIDYTRGIPLIIHLYIAYYFLPPLLKALFGLTPNPLVILVVAYSFYISVGQSENIRGAFSSVETGQWDASFACGLSDAQTLKRIIVPQMLTVALPVMLNSYLGVIKGLSLAFTIGVTDILSQARVASAQNYGYLEAYIAAALVYWALCGALSWIFGKLEQKLTKW
ncbi:MAG TPA: amino acid ABC transporter permease [Clostridia bacterium]|nr:amino acid ABC transporter permease [Clostridia bacterium]